MFKFIEKIKRKFRKKYYYYYTKEQLVKRIDKNGVSKISRYATIIEARTYRNVEKLRKIIIPNTVEVIGMLAFENCKNLECVEFEYGSILKEIGYGAFRNCPSLKEIALPGNLKKIDESVFENCKNLKVVSLPTGLEQIKESAFCNCTSLRSIYLPDSIKKIESYVFFNCFALQRVFWGRNPQIKELSFELFKNCSKLGEFEIPKSVEVVAELALAGCNSLEKIVFHENITTILQAVLAYCPKLKDVTINSKLKMADPSAFLETAVTEVKIGKDARIPYDTFREVKQIRKFYIGDKEINIPEDKTLFSLQKNMNKVALVLKDKNEKTMTKYIDLDTGEEKENQDNIYLSIAGNYVKGYRGFNSLNIKQLREIKESGTKEIYFYGNKSYYCGIFNELDFEKNLYEVDEVIKIKQIEKFIFKDIIIPGKDELDREKKIYGQIVRRIARWVKYDWWAIYYNKDLKNEKVYNHCKKEYEKEHSDKWENFYFENRRRTVKEINNNSQSNRGLFIGKTVCAGYANIIYFALEEFGIESQIILGVGHAWVQAKLDGKWYYDDITWYRKLARNINGTGEMDTLKFFLMSEEGLSEYNSKIKAHKVFDSNQGKITGEKIPLKEKFDYLSFGAEKDPTQEELNVLRKKLKIKEW